MRWPVTLHRQQEAEIAEGSMLSLLPLCSVQDSSARPAFISLTYLANPSHKCQSLISEKILDSVKLTKLTTYPVYPFYGSDGSS